MAKLSGLRPHARGAKNSLGSKFKTAHLKSVRSSKGALGQGAMERRNLAKNASVFGQNVRKGAYGP